MSRKRKRSSSVTKKPPKRVRQSAPRTDDEDLSTPAADCQSTLASSLATSHPNEQNRESDLLRIPVELLEHVAEHLDASDFGSLRLACKEVAERVDHVFANKFFSERCFLTSDITSLATLLQISGHESYSKSMRRIWLCPARLRRLPSFPKALEDRSQRRKRRELRRQHDEMLREEDALYCNYILAHILTAVFLNFKGTGNLPNISFASGQSSTVSKSHNVSEPRPWGLTNLQTITASPYPLQMRESAHDPDLFLALVEAEYCSEEMQIGRCDQYELPMSAFSVPVESFPGANLRRLELSLSATTGDYDDDEQFVHSPYRREEVLGFATFIAHASNLEHLTLYLEPLYDYAWQDGEDEFEEGTSRLRTDLFHSIASKSYLDGTPIPLESDGILLPKLKSIDLRYHQISLGSLLEFCSDRKDTLESVKLRNIVDMDADLRHDSIAGRILTAVEGESDIRCKNIEVSGSCYSGGGWLDLMYYRS